MCLPWCISLLLILVWTALNFLTDFTKLLNKSSCVMWVTVSVCVTESHGSNLKPSITSDCIPGGDLVWPCWIIAALRVCVSKFTHDWREFLVRINNGIKCRPHHWLPWSDTLHYSTSGSLRASGGSYRADTVRTMALQMWYTGQGSPSVPWKLSKGLLLAWLKACVYMTLCILVPISICLYWGRHMEGVGTLF